MQLLGLIPGSILHSRGSRSLQRFGFGELVPVWLGAEQQEADEQSCVRPWGNKCRAAVNAVPLIILLMVCYS